MVTLWFITNLDTSFLEAKINSDLADRMQLSHNFCLEFWLKYDSLTQLTIFDSQHLTLILQPSTFLISFKGK